jgi:hypothetical protein|tara:strand:+ start:274 stop:456 length:183 start_codon:yes stop_codon:yes gene_type:complete
MPNLIAIANFIGINELGLTPPFGGQELITEPDTPIVGGVSVSMVTEDGTGLGNEDIITEG